jgi:hypothetical protein
MVGRSHQVQALSVVRPIINRKQVYCIDNLDQYTSIDDMHQFLTASLGIDVMSLFTVRSRRRQFDRNFRRRVAFRLCIDVEDEHKLLCPDKWPDGVEISTWFFDKQNQPKYQQSNNNNINSATDQASTDGGHDGVSFSAGALHGDLNSVHDLGCNDQRGAGGGSIPLGGSGRNFIQSTLAVETADNRSCLISSTAPSSRQSQGATHDVVILATSSATSVSSNATEGRNVDADINKNTTDSNFSGNSSHCLIGEVGSGTGDNGGSSHIDAGSAMELGDSSSPNDSVETVVANSTLKGSHLESTPNRSASSLTADQYTNRDGLPLGSSVGIDGLNLSVVDNKSSTDSIASTSASGVLLSDRSLDNTINYFVENG